MSKPKIRIDDRKWKGLADKIKAMHAARVDVGILQSGKGNEPHEGSPDLTVLEIANIHEFGAPKAGIPARPWVSAGAKHQPTRTKKKLEGLVRSLVTGKTSVRAGFDTLGLYGQNLIKNYVTIGSNIKPPNSAQTIKLKGSARPLQDTHHMVNSLTFVVRDGGTKGRGGGKR